SRRLQVRSNTVEVRWQQPAVEILRDAVERPGQRVALERADEQAAVLLAAVEGAVRGAEDRQFGPEPRDLLDRLGDEVVVLHRHEREVVTGEPRDLASPLPGGVDDDPG